MSGSPPPADAEAAARECLERYVEGHLAGERPEVERLCADRPELLARVRALVAGYHAVESALAAPAGDGIADPDAGVLPAFEGYRTVERLGRGGGGDVYKLQDLTLPRMVAAKVLRPGSPLSAALPDFLGEARSLALFDDPRIVRLLEFRQGDPPVLLMEYVDGFGLGEIGPSLTMPQRARIVEEVAETLHRAHLLGLQHRDLKPENVLVDARLRPKILDFGLSGGDSTRGHGLGTLAYMAPEQLDPRRPIDARTDVYALGVVLYELLCGTRPYEGPDDAATIARIREGQPRLPIEIEGAVPEPLQAIALTAMSVEPGHRYPSAQEMALDLRRYQEGRPVTAQPSIYRSALERRMAPHLEQITEWERLKLVYAHEAERLRGAYRRLRAREDDWIVQGRVLSFPQIALYVGAFLLLCASVLAFEAHRQGGMRGLAWPLAALGLPCVLLHMAGQRLYRGHYKAAAVAFYLGGAALVPSMLLIAFQEMGWWPRNPGSPLELFGNVSNRQLQVAALASCLWAAHLAVRTRTVALSSGFTALLVALHLAWLGDYGLRLWWDEGRWDRLSLHLAPLLIAVLLLGLWTERQGRTWLAEPLHVAAALLFVSVLELLALDGRALGYAGLTLSVPGGAAVSDPTLLDTVAVLSANGLIFYVMAGLLERRGTRLQQPIASALYAISPFALLEPLAYLGNTGEYSRGFDWLYLLLAMTVAFASRYRQRRSFYYAGLLNTATAIALLTDHYGFKDRPWWTVVIVLAGVGLLAAGLALDWAQRRSAKAPSH